MTSRAPKSSGSGSPESILAPLGHHFGGRMIPGGTQRAPKKKRSSFGDFCPLPLGTRFDTFWQKTSKTNPKSKVVLATQSKHTFAAEVSCKMGNPRTPKMCLKHNKYAVGCKVAFLQKTVTKTATRGSSWEAFGVTLGHFGHQMAPQRPFFEESKIGRKNGSGRSF